MQIFVNGPERTRVISMEGTKTVDDLHTEVEREFGITRNFQTLSYAGKQVGTDLKLCGVLADGCTVHLSLPTRGGRGSANGADAENNWLDLYSFDNEPAYLPDRPDGLQDFARPGTHRPDSADFEFPEVPVLPDDDLADFDMDAESLDFLHETVNASDGASARLLANEWSGGGSVSPPDTVRTSGQQTILSAECKSNESETASIVTGSPSPVFTLDALEDDSTLHKSKRTKGVAYDLNAVDDKMRRRLIKNRQSAERSRQKKNALMKELEDELHKSRMENVALKRETASLRTAHSTLEDENASLRALLEAHGVQLDVAHVA